MRSAFFWDITQRRVVLLYRRFGTTYRFHLQGSRNPILGLLIYFKKLTSSVMWRRKIWYTDTNISERPATFSFPNLHGVTCQLQLVHQQSRRIHCWLDMHSRVTYSLTSWQLVSHSINTSSYMELHHLIHKSPPHNPTLSHTNPFYPLPHLFPLRP
jgi:hypothetical protein